MSDPTPTPSPPAPAEPVKPAEAKLVGTKEPKPEATKKSRTHADATDLTIQLLTDNLERDRLEHEKAIEKLRLDSQKEVAQLQSELKGERDKLRGLTEECRTLAVDCERLATENVALRREQGRGKLLEFVATLLLGVGGGTVSYATDQKVKDAALIAILVGGGVFALNFLAGVIVGAMPKKKASSN